MKNYLIFSLFSVVALCSCSQRDYRAQYPVDKVPPAAITSPSVENIPGGAIISYKIPNDEDLLYVMASYTRNGKRVEQKASVYESSLEIVGFGKPAEVSVELTAYDRSNNASEPVTVVAHPGASPIYEIFNTIKAQNDFGGIYVHWNNPLRADIQVTILAPDPNDNGKITEVQTFFSRTANGFGNLRGYPTGDVEMGIFVHDQWGNTSDTLRGMYNPIFEMEIDKAKFARWNPPSMPYDAYPDPNNWGIEGAWDNSITSGFANFTLGFTFDMGIKAKLSRFVINQRTPPLAYTLGHMRIFELWGTNDPGAVNADTSTWEYLGTFESIKPSGLPDGEVTADDVEYASTIGEPFVVPSEAPAVRYIWVRCIETWSHADVIQFMEMTFFGSEQ